MDHPSKDHHERIAHLMTTIPELGASTVGAATIRVPELDNVAFTRRVQAVVDHPAFQRLRRIRQLGPTHLVYPGAMHTRFEHSLGVYSCVRRYVASLLRTPDFALSIDEEDILTILAVGLLHDVGHYPFAHSLEALHHKGRDTPRHEDVGAQIIRGEFAALRGDRTVARILRDDWNVDPERVIALSKGEPGTDPVDRVLGSIISSGIDADKMDYLERDSIHLGVPYGRNYDRDRLLASLTLNQDRTSIAVLAKGKVSAEIFIFSRYTMFSEAYWHHTVRSASAMLEAALAAFYSRSELEPDDLVEILLDHDDDSFLRWLSETTPESSATRYILENVTGNRRTLYKRIATFSRVYTEADKQKAYEILYGMSAPQLYELTDRLRIRLASIVGRTLHPADLIIDTPPRDKDKLDTVDVVYPDAQGRTHYPLHELSRIVAGVQHDFVKVVKKIRLFASSSLAASLASRPEDVEGIILSVIMDSK